MGARERREEGDNEVKDDKDLSRVVQECQQEGRRIQTSDSLKTTPSKKEMKKNEQRKERMLGQLRISERGVINLLDLVTTTDIIIIADDSGSMNQCADAAATDAETRWEELRHNLKRLLKLLIICGHSEGFRLKFLNDDQWYDIRKRPELDKVFHAKPKAYGKTPLKTTLEPLLKTTNAKKIPSEDRKIQKEDSSLEERDTVIIVLTDGEPSDCTFEELAETIHDKAQTTYVSFVMTTDEQFVVDRYKALCDSIPHCEITNDFYSERIQARRFDNELTHHQWLARILLVKYDQRDYSKFHPSRKHLTLRHLTLRNLTTSSHKSCCLLQ